MEQILQKLGFSEYKIKAYMTLLKLKKATPCQVAKISRIPSSKIYEVLGWLYEKGYIVQTSEKPVMYEANNPKYILSSEIKSRMDVLEELKKSVDEIGNITLGLKEQTIFPETADEEVRDLFGMAVTIVTTAQSKKEAEKFFEVIGVPFKKA